MKKSAIISVLVVVISLFVAMPVRAADQPMLYAGWGGFTLGMLTLDVGDLNDFLEPAGLDGISPIWLTLGGEAHGLLFGNLVLGLHGGASFHSAEESYAARASDASGMGYEGDISLDLLATYCQFDVGYAVINGKWGLGYPFIGLGGSAVRMKLEDDIQRVGLGPLDEEAIFTGDDGETTSSLTLRKSQMYTSVGFTYFWPVRFAEGMGGGFGMFLPGLSAGADFALIDTGWRDDGELVTGGPDLDFTGFFIRMEVAFGGGVVRTDDEAAWK